MPNQSLGNNFAENIEANHGLNCVGTPNVEHP